MEKHKVLDLFAGAGGLSLGFSQTGRFETVLAVEINENAAKTYTQNHKIEVNTQDIRSINFKDYKKYPKLKDVSLIIGGPPCQGFSNANRQKSELFSNNNLLVKEFVRAIKEIQPVAFVMENVKTISSDKHKFFVTNGELEEITSIGVQIKEEDLFIGNSDFFNEHLMNLFNERKILSSFADTSLITKLKSLVRYANKHKSVKGFIDKNSSFFNRYIPNWNQHFNTYEYEELRDLICDFKLALESDTKNEDFSLTLLAQAKQIIEIHNITLIFKEIIEKKIEYSTTFTKKGKGIFVKGFTFTVIDYLLKTFESLGYLLAYDVLNSAHFGVPQERNRYFIIGHRNSQPSLPASILSKEDFFNIGHAIEDLEELEPSFNASDDTQIKKNKRLNHPLSKYLNADVEFLSNHVVTQSTKTALKRFKSLTPGQNFHNLDDSLKSTYADNKRTQNTIYKRLDYSDVCNTVVNVRKSMWIHPIKDRAISIREAARLQSFPDDYIFTGTKDSQYQQIGNAVPPLLGRAVAEQLLSSLNDKPQKSLVQLFNKEKEAVY
ncbi:DNA cytosine methyltransferase [Halalkalibacter sp. AB-rgal2]|uniref:DNA cytosine methyltransferase n=1 Tax=Halalkalibacter sp. AB-rgal2 TaxID=3242695 RepID=UPI00359E70D8